MTRKILSLLLLVISSFSLCAKEVYVLRLDDEIGSKTWRYTREALNDAQQRGSDLILVHLNTYGGSVVHADSIRTALLNYPGPVVSFVDNNAASAGALIALACDTVFMRQGASMGAATVVNGADGEAMPDKYQSYMRAMMRSTAEHHGKYLDGSDSLKWRRDPVIAEAMVDTRVIVPGLIDSTRVLTFTTDEAIKWHFAEDKAESISEVLDKLDASDYTIKEYAPTWLDHLIGFFTNPAVQAVLIMIIVGGIYMELHSPGVGFPSAAAIIAAVLYFLPLYISGIASSWIILIFVAGIILVVLEMFVVPGFGVTGIAGISCICIALLLGLIEHYTFSITQVDASSLWSSLVIFVAGVLLAVVAIWYLTSSYGPKWIRRHTDLMLTQQVKDGYIGVDMTPSYYVGLDGVAVTDMRPAGKVEIDGKELDAVAIRGFVDAGTRVKVVKYENAQIYVKEV
ncbi:MAG: nodulation protein NfeD [Muribaculum sp.]|nr:nodulation protein NfeD [Muribaculum sp.]